MGTNWNIIKKNLDKLEIKYLIPSILVILLSFCLTVAFILSYTLIPESIMLFENGTLDKTFDYWLTIILVRIIIYLIPLLTTFIIFCNHKPFKNLRKAIVIVYILYIEFATFFILSLIYKVFSLDIIFSESVFSWFTNLQNLLIIILLNIISRKKR